MTYPKNYFHIAQWCRISSKLSWFYPHWRKQLSFLSNSMINSESYPLLNEECRWISYRFRGCQRAWKSVNIFLISFCHWGLSIVPGCFVPISKCHRWSQVIPSFWPQFLRISDLTGPMFPSPKKSTFLPEVCICFWFLLLLFFFFFLSVCKHYSKVQDRTPDPWFSSSTPAMKSEMSRCLSSCAIFQSRTSFDGIDAHRK